LVFRVARRELLHRPGERLEQGRQRPHRSLREHDERSTSIVRMGAPRDELSCLEAIDQRGCGACRQPGPRRQLRRTRRAVKRDEVETLHIGHVDVEDLSHRLMKENGPDVVLSAAPDDLFDQVSLASRHWPYSLIMKYL